MKDEDHPRREWPLTLFSRVGPRDARVSQPDCPHTWRRTNQRPVDPSIPFHHGLKRPCGSDPGILPAPQLLSRTAVACGRYFCSPVGETTLISSTKALEFLPEVTIANLWFARLLILPHLTQSPSDKPFALHTNYRPLSSANHSDTTIPSAHGSLSAALHVSDRPAASLTMASTLVVTKKRSRTDMESIRESIDIQLPIQVHTRPSTPVERDEVYNMQVLSLDFGRTEDDLDQHFLLTALNLGITVPQDPVTTLGIIADNLSALAISSDKSNSFDEPGRTSESTQSTSCSSSQQHLSPTNASSSTTASIPSAPGSIISSTTKTSSIVKIRKGLRRLSTFTRRKTVGSAIPTILIPTTTIGVQRHESRPATADAARPVSISRMRVQSARTSVSLPEPGASRRSRPKTIIEEVESEEMRYARERSNRDPRLQRVRLHQLEEQDRFLRFEAEQNRLVQLRKVESRRSIVDRYQKMQDNLRERHVEIMADLEHRHLTAELDLSRALQAERRACETRLRHMDAYCNGRTAGMPRRKITEEDFKKLEQQYHIRSGMKSLHSARINVLREKQAKQLERIQAKQDNELSSSTSSMNTELQIHESQFHGEELDLQQDFWDRKKRILARWALAEAIERRKLEHETGQLFAPLPPIPWLDGREMETVARLKRQSLPLGQMNFFKALPPRPLVHREYTA
ncbi:hypothetical protein MMC18_009143 [Xylographa bjoerkii]|nr:hypothetical protein [Xylographa bjoerkii]